ncbi:hypothetical protein [Flavobacterium sp. N2270]|uniref:hypothetical protein n=1 Tax=Flavobacterium sp. N2270 TaxID=2986831 RepID=UPI00222458BC|nr:hypothetical protein [Flavobacterium sp. N2270]
MNLENNWFVKENSKEIEVLKIDIYDFLNDSLIPYNEFITFLDWSNIDNSFENYYDFINNETIIRNALIKSQLNKFEKLIIHIEYDAKLIRVNTDFFVNNWSKFNACNGFTGFVVFTDDKKIFLEFSDDSKSLLYSNFKIIF